MKVEKVKKMSDNIYLKNHNKGVYICKTPSERGLETKWELSQIIVSDCVKGINGMTKTMNREISEKMLGGKNGRRRKVIIGGKHREQRLI